MALPIPMAERPHEYRIDYEAPDVLDIVRQVRERAAADAGGEPWLPSPDEDPRTRLREWLLLDESRPAQLQQSLGLGGDWNVTPEDLRASHPGALGGIIGGMRRTLRPLLKVFANLELPLYKQFKANLGFAAALHDLMQENVELRRRLGELQRRVERLENADEGRDER